METRTFKRIFVTGAAGFVGSAILDELIARDYNINALVHHGNVKQENDPHVRICKGDMFTPRILDEALVNCDAVIHLVGIIQERPRQGSTFDRIHFKGARMVMEAAKRAGISRFIHMSAIGARPEAASEYHSTKYQAEQTLRKSGLEGTIFRPSLIHGPGGEFLKMEADWARGKRAPFLFMPYFGGGLFGTSKPTLIQPVYVKDVARAFVSALEMPQTIGQTYCIGGAEKLTWTQMHHIAAEVFTGKKKAAIGVPAWYARALTRIMPAKLLPFTHDQVIMGREDSVCDMTPFIADLGWEPAGFAQTLKEYASEV